MIPKQRARVRQTLTFWYTASIVALLFASLFAMRAWARRTLLVQETEATTRAIDLVQSFFRTELSEYKRVEPTLEHVSGELVFAEMTVEFLRPGGEVFGRTKSNAAKPHEDSHFETIRPLDERSAPGWMVRLTQSNDSRLRAESRIDRYLLIAVPLLLCVATLLAWVATGRTLRPVGDMASAAEAIARGDTSRRLPLANADDEFGRLGRQFNDLLDQLDGLLRRQRQFLTDAAHELRTPIARMMSAVELRLADAEPNHIAQEPEREGDRRTLQQMHRDLQNVSTLVEELMQLARADMGSRDAGLVDAYLDDIVSDALSAWIPEARRRNIQLEVTNFDEAPAKLDARLIHRLVSVLLGNALGYTPSGGKVAVNVSRNQSAVQLEVKDSGIGIAPDDRSKVFDRFFRGADARRIAPGGSGLGLSIAAWIAQVHNATIELSSVAEGGTVVRVTFPGADTA